jgi:uncharacterized RmlC-like cupin family protein
MSEDDAFPQRLRHVASHALSGDAAQTTGMRRVEAISGATVGSGNLWMGQTHVAASTDSGNHHHGESATAIYVVSGNPSFVFLDEEHGGIRVDTEPGDHIYVPPWVPHREKNPDPENEAVVVISRTTQEAIVVDLTWVGPRRDRLVGGATAVTGVTMGP